VGAALMVLLYLLTGVLVATVPAIGKNTLTLLSWAYEVCLKTDATLIFQSRDNRQRKFSIYRYKIKISYFFNHPLLGNSIRSFLGSTVLPIKSSINKNIRCMSISKMAKNGQDWHFQQFKKGNQRRFTSLYSIAHRVGRVLSVSPVVGIGTPPPL
jgi:hypothetical protein